jgi:hypothetical protein
MKDLKEFQENIRQVIMDLAVLPGVTPDLTDEEMEELEARRANLEERIKNGYRMALQAGYKGTEEDYRALYS